jgi:hypothetical protein
LKVVTPLFSDFLEKPVTFFGFRVYNNRGWCEWRRPGYRRRKYAGALHLAAGFGGGISTNIVGALHLLPK